ncbi:Cell division protein ZapA [Candidatus Hartigia pinicola]|nr:Cell division protein ZapA [Candidatus Hartigia pinicola]
MSTQHINIQIFGRSLSVNCPIEQKESLLVSAQALEQRLQNLKDKSGVVNTEQLIFIATLNLCQELIQEKIKIRNYAYNMEKKIKILQLSLEKTLQDQVKIIKRQIISIE